MEVASSLIFEMIFIVTVELYVYGIVGAILEHSGDERYVPKFLLTIGSIMVEECAVVMSTYTVSRALNNSSTVN